MEQSCRLLARAEKPWRISNYGQEIGAACEGSKPCQSANSRLNPIISISWQIITYCQISKPYLQPCLNPFQWAVDHGPGLLELFLPQKLGYVFIIKELWDQQKPPSVFRKSTNCGTPTPLRIDPKMYGNLPLLSLVSMCSCSISTLT